MHVFVLNGAGVCDGCALGAPVLEGGEHLGTYGGPRGVGVSYERGTPITHILNGAGV